MSARITGLLVCLCTALPAAAQGTPPGQAPRGGASAADEPVDMVAPTAPTAPTAAPAPTAARAADPGPARPAARDSGAHDAAALFADANTAYLAGDSSRALAAYQALVAEGVQSPELETNLGAASLRLGKRGLAALHFERALFLDPGDEDARTDLAEVRRGNVDKLEGESEEGGAEVLGRLLAPLPGAAAAALLLSSWTLGFCLFGLRLLRPRPYLGRAAIAAFALAALGSAITLGAAKGRELALQRGVVVAQSAPAREGPSAKASSSFEVHEGTTLRIQDEENGFRRVKLANGLTGWVVAGAVDLVVPPGWAGRAILASRPSEGQ